MTNKHDCNGCLSDGRACEFLSEYDGYDINECPCRICLIKGVCNDPCEDYEKFSLVKIDDDDYCIDLKYKYKPEDFEPKE